MAEIQFNACSQALTVVDPDWQLEVVLIGTDGKCTMTGRISILKTRFEEAVEFPIVRVWCGLHQIDLVAQKTYLALFDNTFVSNLTGLIAFLWRQSCLHMEMKTTCRKFVSTQWLSMTQVTVWMKKHRMRVLSYLE